MPGGGSSRSWLGLFVSSIAGRFRVCPRLLPQSADPCRRSGLRTGSIGPPHGYHVCGRSILQSGKPLRNLVAPCQILQRCLRPIPIFERMEVFACCRYPPSRSVIQLRRYGIRDVQQARRGNHQRATFSSVARALERRFSWTRNLPTSHPIAAASTARIPWVLSVLRLQG
jgi:hypothetical protein